MLLISRHVQRNEGITASLRTVAFFIVSTLALALASCGDFAPESGTICADVVEKLGACMTDAMQEDYYGDCEGDRAYSAQCRVDGCHCDGVEFLCAGDTCAPE